jgi:hypothetical protein
LSASPSHGEHPGGRGFRCRSKRGLCADSLLLRYAGGGRSGAVEPNACCGRPRTASALLISFRRILSTPPLESSLRSKYESCPQPYIHVRSHQIKFVLGYSRICKKLVDTPGLGEITCMQFGTALVTTQVACHSPEFRTCCFHQYQ